MCGYCGCGQSDAKTDLAHHHHHDEQIIQIEKNILAENQRFADSNREWLKNQNILTLNMVSSPGSGKTTLLTQTILALKNHIPIAVIEGDQQTDRDAKRIAETGVDVLQINTGKACHLDAHRISHVLPEMPLKKNSLLLIENVGNLVCPALFDLGEAHKVVVLSVTEGDDKPLKYPHMFAESSLMIINKMDLLPHVNFDIDKCIQYASRINPKIQVIKTTATSDAGIQDWTRWITQQQPQFASLSE